MVFVSEEGKVPILVYYDSKRLLDVETHYANMEKLAYALILVARKLRPYFQAHKVEVHTLYPLRQVLHNLEASRRLMKWAFKLGQFDVENKPKSAIKGQALADILLEIPETFHVEVNDSLQHLLLKRPLKKIALRGGPCMLMEPLVEREQWQL